MKTSSLLFAVTLSLIGASLIAADNHGPQSSEAAGVSTVPKEIRDLCNNMEAESKRIQAELDVRVEKAKAVRKEFYERLEPEIKKAWKEKFFKEMSKEVLSLLASYERAVQQIKGLINSKEVDISIKDIQDMLSKLDELYNTKISKLNQDVSLKMREIFNVPTFQAYSAYCYSDRGITFSGGTVMCPLTDSSSTFSSTSSQNHEGFYGGCQIDLSHGCLIPLARTTYGNSKVVSSPAEELALSHQAASLPEFCQKIKKLDQMQTTPHSQSN